MKKQLGQSLIEVMLTVLVVCVGVIALIRFQNYLAYDNTSSQQRSDAMLIAVKQIEILRDFQVVNNTTGYTSYQGIASGSSSVTGTNTAYTVNWTVTTFTDPDYKTINVTVSWTDRYNVSQSATLVSNVAGIDPSSSSTIM